MQEIGISPPATSASALDHDKGKALDPRKMLTHFSAKNSMQSIEE